MAWGKNGHHVKCVQNAANSLLLMKALDNAGMAREGCRADF